MRTLYFAAIASMIIKHVIIGDQQTITERTIALIRDRREKNAASSHTQTSPNYLQQQ